MPGIQEQLLTHQLNTFKDADAFGQLYDLYHRPLYQFIYFRVKTKEDTEDLVAKVFSDALQYVMEERGKAKIENFRAFIYALARNSINEVYRRQGREPLVFSLDEDADDEYQRELPDPHQNIFSDQIKAEELELLSKCLYKLRNEGYKEILILRFLQELNIGEISKIINKSKGTTRVLIHRALKAIRAIMYEARTSSQSTQK